MAPDAWRVCMRQAFTMAAPAAVAAKLAVAGAEAQRSMRLFLVDNDASQARRRLTQFGLYQTRRSSQQGS